MLFEIVCPKCGRDLDSIDYIDHDGSGFEVTRCLGRFHGNCKLCGDVSGDVKISDEEERIERIAKQLFGNLIILRH
jgi:hypothetical protein